MNLCEMIQTSSAASALILLTLILLAGKKILKSHGKTLPREGFRSPACTAVPASEQKKN